MSTRITAHLASLSSQRDEMHLHELHRWLTWTGLSAAAGGAAFVAPVGLIFMAMVVAAFVFTPYMLWRLYNVRRFGWMVAFGIMVGLPFLVSVGASWTTAGGLLLSVLPLFTFYLYTWALRFAVGDWLEDIRGRREFARTDASL